MSRKPTYKELEKQVLELQQDEKYYRLIAENSMDMISKHEPDGIYIYASPACRSLLGYTSDELIGKSAYDFFHPDDRPKISDSHAKILKATVATAVTYRIRHKTGPYIWVETTSKTVRDPNTGEIDEIIAITRDITERKKAEKELEDLYETMDLTQKMAGIGYWSYDKKTEKRMWSSQMYENFGLNPMLGPPRLEDIIKVFHPEDKEIYQRNIQNALEGTPYNQVAKVFFPDGSIHFVHTKAYPRTNDAGDIIGLFGTSQDITERILAEKALRDSEEKYRHIFENSVVGFFQSTPEGRFISVNSAFAKMLRYESPEELLSIITDIGAQYYVNLDDRRRYQKILQKEGKVDGLEFKARCKDGSEIWVSNSTRAYFDDVGQVIRYEGVVNDITHRRLAEEARRESEEKLRAILMASPDPMVMYDTNGVPQYINPAFTDVFGWTMDELKGHRIPFVPADQQSITSGAIREVYHNQVTASFETQRHTKDGRTIDVLISAAAMKGPDGDPSGMIVNLTDISQKKAMQAHYEQAQRMEALGTLAGGIAHDFNNLLMGIQGRISLMAEDLGDTDSHAEHIRAIEDHIQSATSLTTQLLGIARGGKYEVNPIDLNELLVTSANMFGRTRKELRILTKTHGSSLVIEADKRQIEQVFLNLFVNAWQAMPEGGELFLETSLVDLEKSDCEPHGIEPGSYARVSVTDTGIGMERAIQKRIFDPFFTTKDKTRGTGLGLASAYGIVKNHGGMMNVYSEIGHGSAFHIYLPKADKGALGEKATQDRLMKGSETILLVDDEEMILEVTHAMLQRLGYRVMMARSGMDAVEAVTRNGDAIDIVVLDLVLPGMDGGATFDQIRQICPQMPVILSSGYSIDGHAAEIMKRGCNGFIQKPFNLMALSIKIRKVLDDGKNESGLS
ncbi:MAG: PAS domain S-box protein [Pseudomonadota bacterium]